MSNIHLSYGSPSFGPDTDVADVDGWPEILGPMLAGARARGVADALDLVGMAAILIDGTGRVLHASGRAIRAISPLIRVLEDHLVGYDAVTNDALQELVVGAVQTRRDGMTARFVDQEGRPRLFIRALPFPQENSDQPQLLRSVLLVTEIEF